MARENRLRVDEYRVTAQVRDPDNDVRTMIHVNPDDTFANVCLIIHTCDENPSVERQATLCSWVAHESSCEMAYRWEERVITLPEATISAELRRWPPNAPCTGSGKAIIDFYSVPFKLFKSRSC